MSGLTQQQLDGMNGNDMEAMMTEMMKNSSMPSNNNNNIQKTVECNNVRQIAMVINGIHTDIIVTNYVDRMFIVITQMKKMGTMILANTESRGDGNHGSSVNRYSTQVLLGKRDDPLLVIYARQLIEQIHTRLNVDKPVLLSIALKPEGRDSATFQAIINWIIQQL